MSDIHHFIGIGGIGMSGLARILLEKNIPYEKFLEKYRLAKKKCRYFVYKLMLKTLVENPLTIVYLIKESTYYLKRLTNFLKQ